MLSSHEALSRAIAVSSLSRFEASGHDRKRATKARYSISGLPRVVVLRRNNDWGEPMAKQDGTKENEVSDK